MTFFEYRKRRRELKREIGGVDTKWLPQLEANKDRELIALAQSQYQFERSYYEIDLERLETARLRDKASRYGIKIPPFEELWLLDERFPNQPDTASKGYLSQEGKAWVEETVSQIKYERAKKWVDLLTPVLSVLFALAALIISLIALFN